jgi:hypothetical protein
MLYLFDNQIVISIIINIYYPELRLLQAGGLSVYSLAGRERLRKCVIWVKNVAAQA